MATLAPSPRLRGREVELRALGDAFDRVASGHLTTVIVEGEAGVGKSRLLADGYWATPGPAASEVVGGRAQELERTRPFGVLADTLACTGSSPDPRRRAIAGLLATQRDSRGPLTVTSDPGLQFQAVDAFGRPDRVAGPRGAAGGRPWTTCSGPTPPACSPLAPWPPAWPTCRWLLVGCRGCSPRSPELERTLEVVEAGGRAAPAVGPAAARRRWPSWWARWSPPSRAGGCWPRSRGAGGNPLFITELVGALVQEGAIQVSDGRAEVAEPTPAADPAADHPAPAQPPARRHPGGAAGRPASWGRASR